jgi:hypothetical protein
MSLEMKKNEIRHFEVFKDYVRWHTDSWIIAKSKSALFLWYAT